MGATSDPGGVKCVRKCASEGSAAATPGKATNEAANAKSTFAKSEPNMPNRSTRFGPKRSASCPFTSSPMA